jgi:hypothetical protein
MPIFRFPLAFTPSNTHHLLVLMLVSCLASPLECQLTRAEGLITSLTDVHQTSRTCLVLNRYLLSG